MIQFSTARHISATDASLDFKGPLRTILAGDIVTMNDSREIITGGRLCLEGSVISHILRPGDELPQSFEGAPEVDTKGTIYPGLFDLHNHLSYNMIPLWEVDRGFANRIEWQGIPEYYPAVTAPMKLFNEKSDMDYKRAIIRFTECRNIFGGVTTGHGSGRPTDPPNYQGLVRNIEDPLATVLPTVKSLTPDLTKPKDIEEFIEWTGQGRPYIYHLSEGIDDYARDRFRDLQQLPGGLNPHLTCIHCVGLHPEDFEPLKAVAGIVWSPTSNFLLYGQTCRIAEAKKRGIPIAIGADWAPSGCKNILGELKVARATSNHLGGILSDEDLVAAVTIVPAAMIGWDKYLGSISPGKWADLLILEGTGGDHHARLIEAKETSIRAVLIDGRIRVGEANGLVVGNPLSSETVSIGGKSYVLDLAEPGADGAGGMKLSDAIVKISYGLAHLPDFEKSAKELVLKGLPLDVGDWQLEDEMHGESLSSILFKGNTLPAKPMKLAPMTAVDDPDFNTLMRKSVNMPGYAKDAFVD